MKNEYKIDLAISRRIAKERQQQLGEARQLAYTDPLTNVKNKHAYVELEEEYDKAISDGDVEDFAVAVFDLNGLKHINDTKGHQAGDDYLVKSVNMIGAVFGKEELYRFGGDEFVVILRGDKFIRRQELNDKFQKQVDDNLKKTNAPVVALGMSKFRAGQDNTFRAVFNRADKIMYARKDALKEKRSY